MSRQRSKEDGKEKAGRVLTRRLLAGLGIVIAAALAAIGTGIGDRAVDLVAAGDAVLISYSAEEVGWECGSDTYLPEPRSGRVRRAGSPSDWEAFRSQPGAAYAGWDVVEVSIQGESARTITLTGIRFAVRRLQRRAGATFKAPCGGPLSGRGLKANVEANPPLIESSSEVPDGSVYSGGQPGSDTPPITFPWTVSVTDPLLLYIVATADSCYCVWSAEIPWVSGGERGTIRIDGEGEGYTVVGRDGLPGFTMDGDGWYLYREAGAPAY